MTDKITLKGDRIVLGELELPLQHVRYVDVVFRPPRRFVFFGILGLSLFFLSAILGLGLGLLSIFTGTASAASTGWTIGLIFFLGVSTSFATLIFAMVAFPVEWRVHVVTTEGVYVPYANRSWTRARIYANRIRRFLM